MANGLYTTKEISVMTDDALDELLSYYSDTSNAEGVALVREEIEARATDLEAEREAEAAYEAEQDRQEQLHYEMLESQGIFV